MTLIKDSRGRRSWHLTLAIPAVVLLTASFLAGGLDLSVGEFRVILASRSGADYALMLAPFLAAMGWRDYIEKVKCGNGNGGNGKDGAGWPGSCSSSPCSSRAARCR